MSAAIAFPKILKDVRAAASDVVDDTMQRAIQETEQNSPTSDAKIVKSSLSQQPKGNSKIEPRRWSDDNTRIPTM